MSREEGVVVLRALAFAGALWGSASLTAKECGGSVSSLACPEHLTARAGGSAIQKKCTVMRVIQDISFADLPRPAGLGDLYLPESLNENTRLVLAIHGGGWCAMDRYSFSGVARFLCENGYAVFNMEYRLTPTAPWPACGDDCMAAARFLLEPDAIPELRMIRDRRLLVIGGSAGGHLALMTGLRISACRGIISISGVNDHSGMLPRSPHSYEKFFGHKPPFSEAELRSSSPAAYLSESAPPILLTHSIHDTVVNVEASAIFEDAVRANGTAVTAYYYNRRNAGHCIWVDGSDPHRLHPDIEGRVLEFLKALP